MQFSWIILTISTCQLFQRHPAVHVVARQTRGRRRGGSARWRWRRERANSPEVTDIRRNPQGKCSPIFSTHTYLVPPSNHTRARSDSRHYIKISRDTGNKLADKRAETGETGSEINRVAEDEDLREIRRKKKGWQRERKAGRVFQDRSASQTRLYPDSFQ